MLGPLIDQGRIGLVGYSAGGYAGLVVIGGQPDFALGPAHCAKAERDSMFCGWMRRGGILRRHPDWPIVHDDRVRAAVLLAPAYGIYFDRRGLAGVKAAVRIYVGESDEVVRQPYNEDHVRRNLPQPPEYVVVPGGHFVFVSPCRRPIPGPFCHDAAGIDRTAIHRRMNDEIKGFFDRKLGTD
jgi:predicted dienelactone hydrolase